MANRGYLSTPDIIGMKILLFIDNFGSGGAQRQMVVLARLLKQRGAEVRCLAYHKLDFYVPLLSEVGIEVDYIENRFLFSKILAVRRYIRSQSFDVVLAFLDAPSLYAEIAALPSRTWGLVVSERSPQPDNSPLLRKILRKFHRVADVVTTNSHASKLLLEKAVPAIRGKVMTIYNAVDFEQFNTLPMPSTNGDCIKLVVAARFERVKNMRRVVNAIKVVCSESLPIPVRVEWYGEVHPADPQPFTETKQLIEAYGLQDTIELHPATPDIARHYQEASALLHPGLYDGLPNSVCEAMACGKPILLSNVSDAEYLVEDGCNGFLFNPTDHNDIARAILKLVRLTPGQLARMGKESHDKAVTLFDPDAFADRYMNACLQAMREKQL